MSHKCIFFYSPVIIFHLMINKIIFIFTSKTHFANGSNFFLLDSIFLRKYWYRVGTTESKLGGKNNFKMSNV